MAAATTSFLTPPSRRGHASLSLPSGRSSFPGARVGGAAAGSRGCHRGEVVRVRAEEGGGKGAKGSPAPYTSRTTWGGILADKVLDSAVDVSTHLKRSLGGPSKQAKLEKRGGGFVLESDLPVVLVLGSGWGAHSMIKVIDTDAFSVVCVSPSNHFLFTPMLPSTAVGTVEFRSLLEPIRLANPYVTYCEAKADEVDVEKKVARCTSVVKGIGGDPPTFEIPYDTLVVAVGEQPASFGVPGVREHCFFMKEISDAVALRRRVQEVFELAGLPGSSEEEARRVLHFVVVGGGPTGVEFAGTLADFLREDLVRQYPRLVPLVRVTLLQSAATILTQFDARLAARAMETFERMGVDVRTGVRVEEVTATQVILRGGERIDHGVCLWSAGNAPRPLALDIAAQVSKLHVDPFLRLIGARDVIALGDCAKLVAGPLPTTAQVAAQQGAYAAHVINRLYAVGEGGVDARPPTKRTSSLSLADRAFGAIEKVQGAGAGPLGIGGGEYEVTLKKPFEFLSLGILAAVGDDKAVAEIEFFGNKLPVWGSPAFLLWRSVYVTKQVSFRNRVLILFDWLKTRVFGRDLSQF